jgi:hypothetical protein
MPPLAARSAAVTVGPTQVPQLELQAPAAGSAQPATTRNAAAVPPLVCLRGFAQPPRIE